MVKNRLSVKEADIQMMLAAKVHLGTKTCDYQMERYVFKRRSIFVINLGKTWEKLQLAARAIVAVENPEDIIVQSASPYGQRAVLKFSSYTGAHAIAGRHTPGTFTNHIQTSFNEPRLLPIRESALSSIPIIAFCDTDSPMRYVDIAIPCNNKGRLAIGCLYWLLARMVLQMRGVVPYGHDWGVMVDLFFYRDADEGKEGGVKEYMGGSDYAATYVGVRGEQWGRENVDGQWGTDTAAAVRGRNAVFVAGVSSPPSPISVERWAEPAALATASVWDSANATSNIPEVPLPTWKQVMETDLFHSQS
eukprot:Gb_40396 [translate_table: standard]